MLREFREFISKGNVIDLAVAVVIGGAFGAIVNSLVNDLIMPITGIILGGIDLSGLAVKVGQATLTYGNFIQAVVNFLLIAFALFLVVRSYARFRQVEAPPPAEPPEEVRLLAEIRDLLEQRRD